MEAIFLGIHLVIGIALIGIVLIQRSSSDGMGLGSGSGSNFMSGRQTANLLTRTTAILATLFILNSLWLGILATHKTKTSLVEQVEAVGKKDNATEPKDADQNEGEKTEKTKKAKPNTKDDVEKKSDKPDAASEKEPAKESTPSVPLAQ